MEHVKLTPKDFFIYLGSFVAIYVSAVSFINLLFQVINVLFPDALENYTDGYSSGIRIAIASLLVVFPLYVYLVALINKDTRTVPERADLWVRKWLTYLTLFVASIAVVIDLIVLVNTFLSGEITARFVLKVVAVLFVAGAIFAYYLFDLRRDKTVVHPALPFLRYGSLVLVFGAIIGSFFIIGSPMTARNRRFDQERVNGLQSIQWQIVNEWQSKGKLPGTLAELNDPISGFVLPVDPQTGGSFEYSAKGGASFELCAQFTLPNSSKGSEMATRPVQVGNEMEFNWQHSAGRVCYERTIDPLRYPINSKVPTPTKF